MGTTSRDASFDTGQHAASCWQEAWAVCCRRPYHARAGQRVPGEADAICVLDLAPLILQCREVCHAGRCLCGCNNTAGTARCTEPELSKSLIAARWWAHKRPRPAFQAPCPMQPSAAHHLQNPKSRPSLPLLLYIASTTNTT